MTSRRTTAGLLVLAALLGPTVTFGQSHLPPALQKRVKNFKRPGWVVIDGRFAQPQATFSLGELFTFADVDGRFTIVAKPAERAEPLMKASRVALVRLIGSDYAWKLSCVGRLWNDTRTDGTQFMQLLAAPETVTPDEKLRLTKVDIQPHQQVLQASRVRDNEVQIITVVFGKDFVELAVGPSEARADVLVRSTTARQLRIDRPTEVREYLAPLLRLVCGGRSPLAPSAGDVYRAFPDLPADPASAKAIEQLAPALASSEPAARQKASTALTDLGPRGVQAAMKLDTSRLPPEAADRIATLIADATQDKRPPEQLRADSEFLLDCLNDSDANVRAAAGKLVTPTP